MVLLAYKQEVLQDSIFDNVLAGFAEVAAIARHVKIREDIIEQYVSSLPVELLKDVLDAEHHFTGDAESTASYILMLDSINFGSGYKPHLLAEGAQLINKSIYLTLSTRLKIYFEQEGMMGPQALQAITGKNCADIFGLDIEKPYSSEFSNMCSGNLRELGQNIADNYNGSFMSFVDAAEGSAGKMIHNLIKMDNFKDVHEYRGMTIAFYKRAQIAAVDMHLAFKSLGYDLFDDLGLVTMFADNGIPHVLRMDGILEYSASLAGNIDNGEEIVSGSEEEIEIRACAGHAVELMSKVSRLTAVNIDHILWHRSVSNSYYRDAPTHRTLSHYY